MRFWTTAQDGFFYSQLEKAYFTDGCFTAYGAGAQGPGCAELNQHWPGFVDAFVGTIHAVSISLYLLFYIFSTFLILFRLFK